jgi:hypothetical protein
MTILAPEEPMTDAAGDIFDPEIHAAKPDGTPSTKTDGTFRKKRRDAGGAARRSSTSSTSSRPRSSAAAGGSKVLAEQRARHIKAVHDIAAVPTMLLSFVDPVDAYCAQQLTPQLAEALADYAPENPQLAAFLDRASGSGGLLSVLAVLVVGGVQFAHNHGRVPEQYARMMGAKPRHEIEAVLEQRARAMMREQQQAGPAVADE